MALPKGAIFQLVVKYRAVNHQAEPVLWPRPNLEQASSFLKGASCFAALDLLWGFWQMPVGEEGEETPTMIAHKGLLSPSHGPKGVLNATPLL